MEPSTQKLVHTFGAPADLGQEIAGRGDFTEMVRTSMHLLLGTLALRRGAVAECTEEGEIRCVAIWGVGEQLFTDLSISSVEKQEFLTGTASDFLLGTSPSSSGFVNRYRERFERQEIELILPMIVRDEVTGLVLLGRKASGEEFSADDFDTIRAMVRHIGVGIHTHRLLEQVAQRAEENRRLYDQLRATYSSTVQADRKSTRLNSSHSQISYAVFCLKKK